MISLQVPALQENDNVVQGASSDNSSLTLDEICSLIKLASCRIHSKIPSPIAKRVPAKRRIGKKQVTKDVGDSAERPIKKGKKCRAQ